ncbi:MAG: glycosyltransferase [Corynebacterium sp.]|uniref:glycosyltransferase family protein n=1 Tax=Corynebacterium sp. TaxID=1720 RepID=UPI0028FF480A|nr:glycosyltransferase [Corynebacterium sp.]MDU2587502.1 glycosyltransferase [Corynebacterium sp.]
MVNKTEYYFKRARQVARDEGASELIRQTKKRLNVGPVSNRTATFDPLAVTAQGKTNRTSPFKELRVGVIMDEFSLLAWGEEFTIVPILPGDESKLQSQEFDLFLVESAWNGNGGAWKYQLTGSSAPSTALSVIVEKCKQLGIPTAFWNKEDPPHFEEFLDTARLFDFVFTSDVNLVGAYKQALGHDRVWPLSFAAQPTIHNPIRTDMPNYQKGDVAFAGMYFAHKYPERREQMELLLGGAMDASGHLEDGLRIFSRFEGRDERYLFPQPFSQRVVGSLPYRKMISAYKNFKVFLNVNSVVDSPSMCSRRVFELLASGTPVVSTWSKALEKTFPSTELVLVDSREEATLSIRALVNSPELRDRLVHRAQRRIWRSHTYTTRAMEILERVSPSEFGSLKTRPKVSVICSTVREGQLKHVFEQVGRQSGVDVELVLVLHGIQVGDQEIANFAEEARVRQYRVLRKERSSSLGECLNAGVAASSGDFIAKFDDDDFYFASYLLDMYNSWSFSGADLVGKQANYAFLVNEDMLIVRRPEREHRWTNFVAGPTFFGPRNTFVENKFESFSRGEDTAFIRSLLRKGGKIYSTDRFNFVQMRNAGQHTWEVSNTSFLANGRVVGIGQNFESVEC